MSSIRSSGGKLHSVFITHRHHKCSKIKNTFEKFVIDRDNNSRWQQNLKLYSLLRRHVNNSRWQQNLKLYSLQRRRDNNSRWQQNLKLLSCPDNDDSLVDSWFY